MRARSVRARLLLLAIGGIGVTLVFAGVSIDRAFKKHVEARAAEDLVMRVHALASLIGFDAGTQRPRLGRMPDDPRYDQLRGGLYWQISENGAVKQASHSLGGLAIPAWDGAKAHGLQLRPGPFGKPVLGLEREVRIDDGTRERLLDVLVALDHAEIDRVRRAFSSDVASVLLLIAAILGVWAWLQTSLGLKPLREIRMQLERIRGGRAHRFEGPQAGELATVVEELNHLLDHQARQAIRARERAGALAHGLKTPLTIMQGEIAGLESRGDSLTAMVLRSQVSLMRTHVDRELARARTNGMHASGTSFANAIDVVDRLLHLVRHMPRGERIEWVNLLPDGLHLLVDPSDFGEIVGNLLDNARKWASSSVYVQIADLDSASGTVSVVVDDDGPGIPDHLRGRVLLPGERIASDMEGTGLGLSIVTGMLRDYATRLDLSRSPLGGLRASFSLPGWVVAEQIRESA
jgi:signal transduction histidine kinase